MQIFNEFVSKLTVQEIASGYYQQDNATSHTADLSLNRIREMFEERVISKNLWPPQSPDLIPPDYFCGVISNEWRIEIIPKHYANWKKRSLEKSTILKQRLWQEYQTISFVELTYACNVIYEGKHFSHSL